MTPTRSNGTASLPILLCPKCGSSKLQRSHARSTYEKLRKIFNQRAYRCKECGWRGLIKAKSRKRRNIFLFKDYSIGKVVLMVLALLVIIYLLIYLVDWANQDSGG